MYKLKSAIFTAPNGKKSTLHYRENTNDWNTIWGAFVEDEYGICKLDLEPNDVVIDIGAHVGAVTLLLATMRPDLKIYSFEPMLDNFELLQKNVESNDFESEINIFNQAVWFYDDDTVKIYYGDNSKNGKIHKFIGCQFLLHEHLDHRLFRKANTISLSKMFNDNHIFNCKFMKVDCEGAEYGIFKGAPKEVLSMIQRIHGEYHNIDPKKTKTPRQLLLNQTKGVFDDVTPAPEKGTVGPFQFVKKK